MTAAPLNQTRRSAHAHSHLNKKRGLWPRLYFSIYFKPSRWEGLCPTIPSNPSLLGQDGKFLGNQSTCGSEWVLRTQHVEMGQIVLSTLRTFSDSTRRFNLKI